MFKNVLNTISNLEPKFLAVQWEQLWKEIKYTLFWMMIVGW